MTILVVDDSHDIRRLYASYFEYVGARVLVARDGLEALQAVRLFKPDAVLLDLAMPRLTGWEVIDLLRRDPRSRELPIVVLTGYADCRDQTLQAGADIFLSKPCLPHEVFGSITQLLRRAAPSAASRAS
jgi:CheY-like chemotaxis protein